MKIDIRALISLHFSFYMSNIKQTIKYFNLIPAQLFGTIPYYPAWADVTKPLSGRMSDRKALSVHLSLNNNWFDILMFIYY